MPARRDARRLPAGRRGAALLLTFLLVLALSGTGLAVGVLGHHSVRSGRAQLEGFQVWSIAEAALARARRELTVGAQAVGWSASNVAFGPGTDTVTTADNAPTPSPPPATSPTPPRRWPGSASARRRFR
jgi:hypothetical protein